MYSWTAQPEREVRIDGKEYHVDTTLHNVMVLIEMLEDEEFPAVMKIETGLYRLLGEVPDLPLETLSEVFRKLCDAYVYESKEEKAATDLAGNPMPRKTEQVYYSLRYDAALIYAAFRQAYGIDLRRECRDMQWDDFKALLGGLPEDTRFSRVVAVRAEPYPTGRGKEVAEHRRLLREQKRRLSFPGRDFSEESGEI